VGAPRTFGHRNQPDSAFVERRINFGERPMVSIYDDFADECLAHAEAAKSESEKVRLLLQARQWRDAAADYERQPREKPGPSTRHRIERRGRRLYAAPVGLVSVPRNCPGSSFG
jgi:hypothetical protein